MKKLMIALAAVAMAAGVQAAQVEWKAARGFLKDKTAGDNMADQNVYLVLATAGDTFDAFKAGLANGSVKASNIAGNSLYLGTAKTASNGSVAQLSSDDKASLVANGKPYALAVVTFDTIEGKDYYYLSSVQSTGAWEAGTEYTKELATAANWAASSYSADKWQPVSAVPEPTSAMLLLLGVAGLALKRRRV